MSADVSHKVEALSLMCREGSGLFSMESAVLSFVSIDHKVFTCVGCECGTALGMFSYPPSYLNIEIRLSKSVS